MFYVFQALFIFFAKAYGKLKYTQQQMVKLAGGVDALVEPNAGKYT